jgi:hypothetical protein
MFDSLGGLQIDGSWPVLDRNDGQVKGGSGTNVCQNQLASCA